MQHPILSRSIVLCPELDVRHPVEMPGDLSDGCLSVVERDIREHSQQTEYSPGFSDIEDDWSAILTKIQTEQHRRQNIQK